MTEPKTFLRRCELRDALKARGLSERQMKKLIRVGVIKKTKISLTPESPGVWRYVWAPVKAILDKAEAEAK